MGITLFDEYPVYNLRRGDLLLLGVVGATALFIATCYVGNDYFKNQANQKLPETIRKYDDNPMNGSLDSGELERLLRDFELKKR